MIVHTIRQGDRKLKPEKRLPVVIELALQEPRVIVVNALILRIDRPDQCFPHFCLGVKVAVNRLELAGLCIHTAQIHQAVPVTAVVRAAVVKAQGNGSLPQQEQQSQQAQKQNGGNRADGKREVAVSLVRRDGGTVVFRRPARLIRRRGGIARHKAGRLPPCVQIHRHIGRDIGGFFLQIIVNVQIGDRPVGAGLVLVPAGEHHIAV